LISIDDSLHLTAAAATATAAKHQDIKFDEKLS